MKKFIIALCSLALPLCVNAQVEGLFDSPSSVTKKQKIEKADLGKVPTENGKVVFRQSFSAPSMSKKEIYSMVGYWADKRYEAKGTRSEWDQPNFFKNLEYSCVKQANKAEGNILCQGAEELVFTNKFLVKNYTECYYTLKIHVEEGKLDAEISNIYYIMDAGEKRTKVTAEEWITDSEVVTKKGKVLKAPARFRSKTLVMVNQIFNEMGIITKQNKK